MPGYGLQAWTALPPEERQIFYAAHANDLATASRWINERRSRLDALMRERLGQPDVPALWVDAAVDSQAIAHAAADLLSSKLGIGPERLRTAWLQADPDARQAAMSNAAKIFGLNDQPAVDPRKALWFLQALDVAPTNAETAAQVLIYMNAQAQSAWAETLIDTFLAKAGAVQSSS